MAILIPERNVLREKFLAQGWTEKVETFPGLTLNTANWTNTGAYPWDDGNRRDGTNWGNFDTESPRKKQEWNKPEQVTVNNGLTITADTMPTEMHTRPADGLDYAFDHTSGVIHSYNKWTWTPPFYAELVWKINGDVGWDAGWFLQNDGSFPAHGEIDLGENFGRGGDQISFNLHTYTPGYAQYKGDVNRTDFSSNLSDTWYADGFHKLSMYHDANDTMTFYVNDVLHHTISGSHVPNDHTYYWLLCLQFGGKGAPDPDTGTYPLSMQVQRVSVVTPPA